MLLGIEEGLLETDPGKELAAILCYILNLRYTGAYTPFQNPYIIRLLRWTLQKLLLRAAYNKKNLPWRGKPVSCPPGSPGGNTAEGRIWG